MRTREYSFDELVQSFGAQSRFLRQHESFTNGLDHVYAEDIANHFEL